MASILLGNVKGPQGDTGATGPKGDTGNAATVRAGSVTTVPYGQNARVTNSGDEHDAVFDFVIPQGRPGEQTTDMENLTLSSMTEPSAQFPIPSIGDTGKVIFGKITKWFSDMAALVATKLNASNVVNNLTTTSSGYALDARQGKSLGDALTSQTKYITHVSLTGQTVNSDGQLYIHIPVDFRYALVVLRGVIPSVSSFYLSGMFFTNYYNISNFTEIDKSTDVLSQQVTFGATSGHPVLIIRLGTDYTGRSVDCDIAVVACSLKA